MSLSETIFMKESYVKVACVKMSELRIGGPTQSQCEKLAISFYENVAYLSYFCTIFLVLWTLFGT